MIGDELRGEEVQQSGRFFVVKDLDFKLVSEIAKELVGREVGGAQVGSGARGRGLDVDIAFVN